MRIFFLISFSLLCLGIPYGVAQSIQRLSLGDKLPSLDIVNVLNHPDSVLRTRDFDGRAIILDFGSTSCPPCILSIAKLDSLQKMFGGELESISVMRDKKERVEKLLLHNPIVNGSKIPFVFEDTRLNELFSHITQPHIVWIDKQGVVKAFTNHHYITKENIQDFLAGNELDWPVKWDFPYDYNKPMVEFKADNFRKEMYPEYWQSAVITHHLKGVLWRQYVDTDTINKKVRVVALNISIPKMYLSLNNRIWLYNFYPSQLILDGVDPNKLVYNKDIHGQKAEWEQENTYCYEMVFPVSLSDKERNERIIQQLNWYFGLEVRFQRIKRPCWIIYQTGQSAIPMQEMGEGGKLAIKDLVHLLNQIPGHLPVFLEAARAGVREHGGSQVAIDEAAFHDLDLLASELEPYGFTAEIQEREVETLFVKQISTD